MAHGPLVKGYHASLTNWSSGFESSVVYGSGVCRSAQHPVKVPEPVRFWSLPRRCGVMAAHLVRTEAVGVRFLWPARTHGDLDDSHLATNQESGVRFLVSARVSSTMAMQRALTPHIRVRFPGDSLDQWPSPVCPRTV